MYSLILDSSTKILYVCLIKDNSILFEEYISGRNDHAKNIVKKVDEALKSASISASDLDEVVCGIGPGSYTGVRMAVTVCKMLAVFMNKPLYTISTLRLMASGYKGKVLSMIDARRGNAFSMIIDNDKNETILDEGMYEINTLDKDFVDFIVKEDDYKVDPFYCLNNKNLCEEPHLLVPNYLRDTEAERNLK